MLFRKNKNRFILPAEITEYRELNKLKIKKTENISDLKFTVIDTETTGIKTDKHSIVSFAGVSISNRAINISESLDILFTDVNNQVDESVHIHEITAEEKTNGVPPEEALILILSFLKNTILAGFYTGFDIKFLNKALKQYYNIKILNPVLDISKLIDRLEGPVQKSYPVSRQEDLETLCNRFNIPVEKKHTAAGDVLATAQLFLKILGGLEKRGITTWGELKK